MASMSCMADLCGLVPATVPTGHNSLISALNSVGWPTASAAVPVIVRSPQQHPPLSVEGYFSVLKIASKSLLFE